jgi:hypothetical protein
LAEKGAKKAGKGTVRGTTYVERASVEAGNSERGMRQMEWSAKKGWGCRSEAEWWRIAFRALHP